MTSRAEAGRSLVDFTDDVGIPEMLTTDGAGEFTGRNTDLSKKPDACESSSTQQNRDERTRTTQPNER